MPPATALRSTKPPRFSSSCLSPKLGSPSARGLACARRTPPHPRSPSSQGQEVLHSSRHRKERRPSFPSLCRVGLASLDTRRRSQGTAAASEPAVAASSRLAIRAMSAYDEIDIEDMDWNEELQSYTYSCPCGDLFAISLASPGAQGRAGVAFAGRRGRPPPHSRRTKDRLPPIPGRTARRRGGGAVSILLPASFRGVRPGRLRCGGADGGG